MSTKVKGEKIKEGSIPLSALSNEVKNKIAKPDWGASIIDNGYIANKTHDAYFASIYYDKENNKGEYEVYNFGDKLLLRYNEKYFTVYKNIPLTIDVYDGEDTFVVDYNGSTLFITDNNGMLQSEYRRISVSETIIPLEEVFIPDTIIKTIPQKLSDTDKNQALANLGIDPVVWKYICKPYIFSGDKYTAGQPIPSELMEGGNLKYKIPAMYRINISNNYVHPNGDNIDFSYIDNQYGEYTPIYVGENILQTTFLNNGYPVCVSIASTGKWSIEVSI